MAIKKFPAFPSDGDTIADINGNVWEYDESTRSWILNGVLTLPDIVSEDADGLITGEIYDHIQQLRDSVNEGIQYAPFKIYPNTEAYYYILRSTNKTIKISSEDDDVLRLEVNRQRLHYYFSKYPCVGEKGPTGDEGLPGLNGIPGKPEDTFTPVIQGSTFSINAAVDTPIDTDISLRLYLNSAEALVFLISPNPGTDGKVSYVFQDNDTYTIADSTSFTYVDDILNGTIVLDDVWPSGTWTYKVSQRGRKGEPGEDGNDFWDIVHRSFSDSHLKATQAITSIRHGGGNNLFYLVSNLFDKVCVKSVASPLSGNCSIANVNPFGVDGNVTPLVDERENGTTVWDKIVLASVEQTINECKDIYSYKYSPIKYDQLSLTLPSWTPTTACYSPKLWVKSNYKWWTLLDDSANVDYIDCNGDPKTIAYPWRIITPKQPDEQCCADDFFYCPNVNDGPCGIDGSFPSQNINDTDLGSDCCVCDCAITAEVEGAGYIFETAAVGTNGIVTNEDGFIDPNVEVQCASCDLVGRPHYYYNTVKHDGPVSSPIVIRFSIELDRSVCSDRPDVVLDGNVGAPLADGQDCGPPLTTSECYATFTAQANFTDANYTLLSTRTQSVRLPTKFPDEEGEASEKKVTIDHVYVADKAGDQSFTTIVASQGYCCLGYKVCIEIMPASQCYPFFTIYNNIIPDSSLDIGTLVEPESLIGRMTDLSPNNNGATSCGSCDEDHSCPQFPTWDGFGLPTQHVEAAAAFSATDFDKAFPNKNVVNSLMEYRNGLNGVCPAQSLGLLTVDTSYLSLNTIYSDVDRGLPPNYPPHLTPDKFLFLRSVLVNPTSCGQHFDLLGDQKHVGNNYWLRDIACSGQIPSVTNMLSVIGAATFGMCTKVFDLGKNYVILLHGCECTDIPSLSPSPSPSVDVNPSISPSPSASASPSPSSSSSPSPSGSSSPSSCETYNEARGAQAVASVKSSGSGFETPDDYYWSIDNQTVCFAADGSAARLENSYNGRAPVPCTPPELWVTKFGLTIPDGSTIQAMSFRARAKTTVDLAVINSWGFVLNGKKVEDGRPISPMGANITTTWTYFSTTSTLHKSSDYPYDATVFPGGPLWTPADFRDDSFGLYLRASGYATPTTILIDHAEISITYEWCGEQFTISSQSGWSALLEKLK